MSSAAFGLAGSCLVVGGIASILLGIPGTSRDLAPVAGLADLGKRWAELSLPVSAVVGAIVATIVSVMVAARALRTRVAAVELLVLGVAIEVSLIAAVHRIGYQANGSVLPAAVICLCGGAAVVVAAFAAAAARD